jgi:hypothetical protein
MDAANYRAKSTLDVCHHGELKGSSQATLLRAATFCAGFLFKISNLRAKHASLAYRGLRNGDALTDGRLLPGTKRMRLYLCRVAEN